MNMHYSSVLVSFKIEWDTYEELNKKNDPDVPVINDKDKYHKVIKCMSIVTDCLSQTYVFGGTLVYVL